MNQSGVYIIRCEANGKRYIGASVNMVKRIREHFYRLEKGIHRNRKLQRSYNEFGEDGFKSEVLLYCDPGDVEANGKKIIKKLHPEFNIVNNRSSREDFRAFQRVLKQNKKEVQRQLKFYKILQRWTHSR